MPCSPRWPSPGLSWPESRRWLSDEISPSPVCAKHQRFKSLIFSVRRALRIHVSFSWGKCHLFPLVNIKSPFVPSAPSGRYTLQATGCIHATTKIKGGG